MFLEYNIMLFRYAMSRNILGRRKDILYSSEIGRGRGEKGRLDARILARLFRFFLPRKRQRKFTKTFFLDMKEVFFTVSYIVKIRIMF